MRTMIEEAWDHIFLLALFADSKEPLDNLKIQKVVFISENEARTKDLLAAHYPFHRNKFGPYSPPLANDVRKLEDCGFIYPETRQPAQRGSYLLDYISDDLKESRSARYCLDILEATRTKYQNISSFALKDLVYEMSVPVDQFQGKIMKVRDIPMKATIIHPSLEHFKNTPILPDDLLDDIFAELSLTAAELDPDSPANIQMTRELLARALNS